MAYLSGGPIFTWLLCLAIAVAITVAIESLFRKKLPQWGLHSGIRIWAYIIEFAFLCSLAAAPLLSGADWTTAIFFHTLPVVAVLIYFVPTAIAVERSASHVEFIFFVNLLAGWTVVGWVWALMGSIRAVRHQREEIVAERIAPPPPVRGPFVTPGMFMRQQPRYFVGKGAEEPVERAAPAADPPPVEAQVRARPAGTIFGRTVGGAEAPAPQGAAPSAKPTVTTG